MDYKQVHQRAGVDSSVRDTADVQPPGKRTLTEGLAVQRKEGAAEPGEAAARGAGSSAPLAAPIPSGVSLQMLFGVQRMAAASPADDAAHAAAARGTATPSTTLPYVDRIQRAFGGHDISKIQAHVGPEAAASARDMGAHAYATGDHVVLGQRADLHTVAHEAAHVVQQRSGVHLKGGVGQVGDAHEQHADAVADRVVAGQAASDLLDQYARPGGGASGAGIQMKSASTLPHPVPAAVTTVGYYVARNKDFQKRYPSAPPNPPSYYMGYGDKYAHRFTTVLSPKLSAKGQAWIWRTFTSLQLAMENKLIADKAAFDVMEKDDNAFKKFAYSTHPKAYLEGGLHQLPVTDLVTIAKTPDIGDLLTLDGIKQVFKTALGLVPQWAGDAEHKAAHWLKSHFHL
jgi:Domain of unknown function (DUF4157)